MSEEIVESAENITNELTNTISSEISPKSELVTVKYNQDGDSLTLTNGSKVRLLCIDTPESVGKYKNNPMPFGKEASDFVKDLIPEGTQVNLIYEGSKTDKYGRLLAYVELEDGTDLNALLISKGLGRVAYLYEARSLYPDSLENSVNETLKLHKFSFIDFHPRNNISLLYDNFPMKR
ncbi:thermonuclease family protein [Bacillus sp. SM2101]|uniref:thermonuclease family protein n=1 Tax=Bacillus sp. SM2101 TaxID=2805366 RepID=UPI001BDF4D8B|nr:thermonuclease family protein [Bacillus sp. SM2101]